MKSNSLGSVVLHGVAGFAGLIGIVIATPHVAATPFHYHARILPAENVTISSAATANMLCTKDICSPTGKNAVLNTNDLEKLLAGSNIEVTTGNGTSKAGDLIVAAPFGWKGKTSLALDAYRSIRFEARVAVLGAGGVALTTNDGATNGKLRFDISKGGRVTFARLKSRLFINGARFTLVNDIKTMADDIVSNLAGDFALADNYDAGQDGTYGQAPIQTGITDPFVGKLDGLGNGISNLSIADSSSGMDGLFAATGSGGEISNLLLVDVAISGTGSGGALVAFNDGALLDGDAGSGAISGEQAGGLVGLNGGRISGCSTNVAVTAQSQAGGIAGENAQGGLIDASRANGVVSATASAGEAGGVVGNDYYGTIRNSSAAGAVTVGAEGQGGGLVGFGLSDKVDVSYASGAVSGAREAMVGGLVGDSYDGTISRSHATGSVSSGDDSREGGLVGDSLALVDRSFATGTVSGTNDETAGGLIGLNSGAISGSFATGALDAGDNTGDGLEGLGGLAGLSEPGSTIDNSYATGAVTGGEDTNIGGLVGYYYDYNIGATISYSYSTGLLTGGSKSTVGGLVGFDSNGSGPITDSYWDTTTSGVSNPDQGVGNIAGFQGVEGLTTDRFQSGLPPGFDPATWLEKSKINGGLPFLRANRPPGAG